MCSIHTQAERKPSFVGASLPCSLVSTADGSIGARTTGTLRKDTQERLANPHRATTSHLGHENGSRWLLAGLWDDEHERGGMMDS